MKRWISMLMIPVLLLSGCAAQAEAESALRSYAAVEVLDRDGELSGSIISVNAGESAVWAAAGTLSLRDASIVRSCDAPSFGDAARLYGAGAAVLATGGSINMLDSAVDTDAPGAAGLFACGGRLDAANVSINTLQSDSAGICASLEGVLRAQALSVTTGGTDSPAIRALSGGSVTVEGGSYAADGVDSVAVYAAAGRIAATDAQFRTGAGEVVRLEEGGEVRLENCRLDAAAAKSPDGYACAVRLCGADGGRFEMSGGVLSAQCGDLFCMEGGAAEIVLSSVQLTAAEEDRLLVCAGGSGRFTAIGQALSGDVRLSGGADLDFYLCEGSSFTGSVGSDADAASGACSLYIDESSVWTVTGDSALASLSCAGTIVDGEGRSVRVVGTDGTLYLQGESAYTVTVDRYQKLCDMSGAGRIAPAQEDSAELEAAA